MAAPGSMCKISGLQSRSDLNGRTALVLSYSPQRQRFAVEDTISGERMMVKAANLKPDDAVLQLHRGRLGDMECSHLYAPELLRLACPGVDPVARQWPQELFSAVKAVSDHQLLLLDLAAIGHTCVLQVLRTPAGLRGRLLQSWVKNPAQGSPQAPQGPRGFSAREWLQRESAGWMEEGELKAWCERLTELKRLVEELTADELLDCARAKGKFRESEQRTWAGDLVNNVRSRPLSQQPGSLELSAGYAKSMVEKGFPPNFVVYAGLGSPGGLEQVLDFPLERGLPILRLCRELFSSDFSAFMWLRAVEFHSHPSG